jgi:hypothetical protein
LRELKVLKNAIPRYRGFYNQIVMDGSKLGKFVSKNPKFGDVLAKMLFNPKEAEAVLRKFNNPSKVEKILSKFKIKTKNPKANLAELDGTTLFRDGAYTFKIEN